MASNGFFNEIIKEINQFVTVPQSARTETTKCYDALVNTIIKEMKKENELFSILFNGVKLAGSYADGLKVSNADEYDTNFILKFPMDYQTQIEVKAADAKHGYITINIQKGLDVLAKSSVLVYHKLLLAGFFDKEGYLLQDKVKAWMHGVLQSVLNKLQRKGQEFIIQTEKYHCLIKDTQSGPAHTLNVRVENTKINFSLDLVVAFCFNSHHWLSTRQPPSHIKNLQWLGVPKPDKKKLTDNRFFVSSYAEIERDYLNGKNSLKNLIRLFKKIRDTKKYTNLKSYYIKMIFLWVIEKEDKNYWNKSMGELFLAMFEVLLKHLNEGKLLFFWDERQNLFGDFKPQQLQAMHAQLLAEQKKILKAIETSDRNAVLNVFLNDEEKKAMQGSVPSTSPSTSNSTASVQPTPKQNGCKKPANPLVAGGVTKPAILQQTPVVPAQTPEETKSCIIS